MDDVVIDRASAASPASPPDLAATSITITNSMFCPIVLYGQGAGGCAIFVIVIAAGVASFPVNIPGTVLTVRSATGALVTSLSIQPAQAVVIDCSSMAVPNAIGPRPTPTSASPIPADSERRLVGCGGFAGNYVLTREQCWRRTAESYVVPAGAKRTFSVTVTNGIQATSSSTDTLSASLGLGVGASYGAISGALSAGLSQSSSTTQTLSVSHQETRYEQVEFDNSQGTTGKMFLSWELVDTVTVFDPTGLVVKAVVITVNTPTLIDAYPYPPSATE